MHKNKLIVSSIVVSLLFIFVVSALEVKKSEIVVKTEPYQNLSITVIDADTKEELQTFEGRARKFGEYRFTYYGTISKILLSASIVNNDTQETLLNKKLGPYTLGSVSANTTATINIDLYLSKPEEVVVESNVTKKELNESLTNQSSKEKSRIIGFVTGSNGQFSNLYYYIGAGAIAIAILLTILKRRSFMTKSSTPVEPNPKKVRSEKKAPSKTEVIVPAQTTNQTSINDTEKRIAEIQKQLEDIKSEEKLLKLQRQLNQERNELKKLQVEEDFPEDNKTRNNKGVSDNQNNNFNGNNKRF